MRKEDIIYFDVMLNGMFLFQLAYRHCPIFKIDLKDVMSKVYARRPSLEGKNVVLYETKNVVI